MTSTLALVVGLILSPVQADAQAPLSFRSLAAEFTQFHLYFSPVRATLAGERDYDARLPDVSRAAVQARAEAYQTWLDRLGSVDRSALSPSEALDAVLMERALRAELLELVEIRSWERDPAFYVDLLDRAVAPLVMDRSVPVRERMDALAARLRQASTVLAEGRANLRQPPRLFTEMAADGAEGLALFLRGPALAAFDSVAPGPGKDDFLRFADRAATELVDLSNHLREEVMAGPEGPVALGPDRLGWTLLHREHVEVSADRALQALEAEVARTRERLDQAAGRLQGVERPAQVVASITHASLPPAQASARADEVVEEARRWVFRSLLVTVPAEHRPAVEVRPRRSPWERSGVRVPGPLSSFDAPAELEILPPRAGDDRGPAPAATAALVLETAFPGANVAQMYARRAPTALRRVLSAPSLQAGWGLYAADRALEWGFDDAPEGTEVASLARRLRALVEARAALRIHGHGQDLRVAEDELARDGYLSPPQAAVSVRRAAHRPLERGVLAALQLDRLAADYFAARGLDAREDARAFHDAFLATGLPPGLARQALLPDGGAPELP